MPIFYDMKRDKELRDEIRKERARLTEKMLKAKKSGVKTQKPKGKIKKLYHCDTVLDEY